MAQQMDLTEKTQTPPTDKQPETPTQTTAIAQTDESNEIEGADQARSLNSFSSLSSFETAQRMAKALAQSSLLPDTFRGNLPNCMIALEIANRIGCSVFMVCQNMDIIHGRPGWRAQFSIGTVNASGRFTPIRYRWQGKQGDFDWGCRAYACDAKTGEECLGPLVTMKLAKDEGWSDKKGSKWQTIPELMLMYRAASWWTRVYCPEFMLGMGTAEETIDTYGETLSTSETPAALRPGSAKALEAELLGSTAAQ